jgi:hypothetical protein
MAQTGAMLSTGALARVIQVPLVSTAAAAAGLQTQSPAAFGSERDPLLSLFGFEPRLTYASPPLSDAEDVIGIGGRTRQDVHQAVLCHEHSTW